MSVTDRLLLRVAVFGLGRAGGLVVRSCLDSRDLDLASVIVTSAEKDGTDVGVLLGGDPVGVVATRDMEAVARDKDIDAFVYCGLGDPVTVSEVLGLFASYGKTCVTVTGLVHPTTALGATGAAALDACAREGGGRIVGAGWNPGFLLDLLPVVWAASMPGLRHVTAERICDLSAWGDGVLEHLGVGSTREIEPGSWAANLPVEECVQLVSDALSLDVDEVRLEFEPRVAETRREAAGRVVEAGTTVGFRAMGSGFTRGVETVRLGWNCVFAMDHEIDGLRESARLVVQGDSKIEVEASGSTLADGYPPTATRAVNMLRPLAQMPPGLYRPDQVPISARP
ncbi:MAG: hypothetical protein QM655_03200 [Nocardioidaceae bacterium]